MSDEGVNTTDFYSLMTRSGTYLFIPDREHWPRDRIDARLPRVPVIKNGKAVLDKKGKPVTEAASIWLDKHRPVEAMSWLPGAPLLIADRLPAASDWVHRKGVHTFNMYIPPPVFVDGDPAKATPWLEHIHAIYPDDAEHSLDWMAHRVQRPGEKLNHALVWGGLQGIGKDTVWEPVRVAVGATNCKETSPAKLLERFNAFTKAVILRINEGRDLGEGDRFKFYDHIKTLTAAPPNTLPLNEKFIREYYVANVVAVFITTNHKTDGLYLPSDDRRHYVAWSKAERKDFTPAYWNALWQFYERENGYAHIAAYLATRDIAAFDPKAPPPQTAAFWDICSASQAPEDGELADVLDALKNPDSVTLAELRAAAKGETSEWLLDRRSHRSMPHRMERCAYVPLRNPNANDGLWKVKDRRQVVYVKANLNAAQRQAVQRRLMNGQTV
jgi:hypothetical protein